MNRQAVRQLLRLEPTPGSYREIRELWKRHSLAEERRDIPGLLSTLVEDCVYELPSAGRVWHGHEGAATFYRELLAAFPDITFSLTDIVIGPQGVCEEAAVGATHEKDWLDFPASGRQVKFTVVIFFPWDPKRKKFKGEKVYFDAGPGGVAPEPPLKLLPSRP